MKKVLIVLMMFNFTMIYSQNNDKLSLIDTLLIETNARLGTEQIMSGIIKQFMSRKPNAPKSLEQEIQKKIDYNEYMKKVKSAYNTTYTKSEIQELIEVHQSENQELFKQKSEKISKALYDIGSNFGKSAVEIIKTKLQSY